MQCDTSKRTIPMQLRVNACTEIWYIIYMHSWGYFWHNKDNFLILILPELSSTFAVNFFKGKIYFQNFIIYLFMYFIYLFMYFIYLFYFIIYFIIHLFYYIFILILSSSTWYYEYIEKLKLLNSVVYLKVIKEKN